MGTRRSDILLQLTVKTRGKSGWNEEAIELAGMRKKRGGEIVLAQSC